MPAGGYGLTLLLHSLDANYNQFLDSENQSSSASGDRLDRDHARGPRARRLVLRLRGRRHVRSLGRRRRALHARSRVDRDHRLLDGRLRHLQARRAVPRPVRQGPADGRPAWPGHLGATGRPAAGWSAVEHQPHARLAAQHPVPDVERRAGRARARSRARRRRRTASTRSATATSSTSSTRPST